VLEEAHIKLSSLVSDLLGASARRMLKALQPAMGMPEYFALHGRALIKAENEYATAVCWAPLSVPGRSGPAYVRADCQTKTPLPMSPRGQGRLKAYQEKRVVYY
jgi:hypothetical protein